MAVLQPGLVGHVTGVMLAPKRAWRVIAEEAATITSLYRDHVVPLALIPAIAGFVGHVLVGQSAHGLTWRMPVPAALGIAVVHYLLALAQVWLLALTIDGFAPHFDGKRGALPAMKLAAYASTPLWLGGLLLLMPAFAPLVGLVGLYGLWLLYRGLPVLMRAPPERALGYAAAIGAVALLLHIVAMAIVSPGGRFFPPPTAL
jgi:hypothetical protein